MKFYVTTPIYYVNDQPHIGHAYTSLAADVMARWWRMRKREVYFQTGTDEHGQKVQDAADQRGMSPMKHADEMVGNFKDLWRTLGLCHDAFIRTTDGEHKAVVLDILEMLKKNGEIVKRKYKGWYCTPCERFWTEKDMRESGGACPDCKRQLNAIDEENYFFLMSRYSDRLVKHIEQNPGFILPETRRNEVLGFLRTHELGDLCISRPRSRLSWGIPLPFDKEFVTYVWFDALINYYSGTLYLAPKAQEPWWPADVHLIGKDILTTHAVYWSTMLMAAGLELPRTIFAHGWWTVEGRKMSKSLGNVVDPGEMARRYGNDAFRYFLFREVPFGHDGDFSEDALVGRLNNDLANDLGNLASRTLKMAASYFGSEVPEPEEKEQEMSDLSERLLSEMDMALSGLQFQQALKDIWGLVSHTNKYIDTNAPWALAKDPAKKGRLSTVIYSSLEALRMLSLYLHPFLPDATRKLHGALGQSGDLAGVDIEAEARWGGLRPGTGLKDLAALFPRIEKPKLKEENVDPVSDNGRIGIEDFMKVELKTGKVVQAERVKGSKKLLRLLVDTGDTRQVVAGIAEAYSPEDLVGKTVVVVTNLKPAMLMGIESEGMVLAASGDGGKPTLVVPDTEKGPCPPGSRVK
jgi:methionyl-tRNA synthetase